MKMKGIAIMLAVLVAGPALAQTSTSYNLSEHTFNAGGHPHQGTVMTSASYRMSLDSIGEGIAGRGLSSRLYNMDASFGFTYPPPGEVGGLGFTDHQTLAWDPEKSVGVYNLYRGLISGLSGLGYGSCEQHDLAGETAIDTDTPPSTDGYFYLATAENRLFEEGTKGWDSGLAERSNSAPCP
jgi:hypothetical protein